MPRVSEEHLDARRRQILEAARRCFLRNGFHATSMQDVLREADLSAGAVYRYFTGKEEIVVAIATESLAEVTQAMEAAIDAEPPPPLAEVLARALAALERLDDERQLARLAIQVWAEALRSPALADRAGETFGMVRGALTRLVGSYQARGLVSDAVPPEHVARTVAALLPGFLVQRALLGDVDAAMLAGALRALLGPAGPPPHGGPV